jgi:hypothetical protein
MRVNQNSHPIEIMTSQLVFNLASGSVACRFTHHAAMDLQQKLHEIVQVLKAKTGESTGTGRPKPLQPIEYQYTGDVFLEVFCNPNIWANIFVAKVSISLRDDKIRVSSEAELTRIVEDVDRFIEQS